ncbi:MAG: glycosyltransferase family 47 protein, partial [Cytophagales bacterium]|nr:glycosyltransferase family 47 protein [Cytophagales bacterium]
MQKLKLWVDTSLFIEGRRPCPLLMHLSDPDTEPQLLFWNRLRETLPDWVEICEYTDPTEAGEIVVIPHEIKEYLGMETLPGQSYVKTEPSGGLKQKLKDIVRKVQPLYRRIAPKWRAARSFWYRTKYDHISTREIRKYIRAVAATGRRVVVFSGGLEYEPQPGEIVFGASIYRGADTKIFPMPNWIYDISSLYRLLEKPPVPTIAFDGNTNYPNVYNHVAKHLPIIGFLVQRTAANRLLCRFLTLKARMVVARWVRKTSVNALREAPQLQVHIRERGEFFSMSLEAKAQARQEYLDAIRSNAYLLCVRGDANTDFRTMEVLAAGRIPVMADTKLVLPMLNGMRWEDFCVFVPFRDIDKVGEIVAAHHASLSEADFQAKCRIAREAFEQLLPHQYVR